MATAAPNLNITSNTCTITKSGNQYIFLATGTYIAESKSNVDYQINGYSATLRNMGGQNVQETGLVSIAPTPLLNGATIWNQTFSYRFASSLKDVHFRVYNGGKQKGDATAQCIRVGW